MIGYQQRLKEHVACRRVNKSIATSLAKLRNNDVSKTLAVGKISAIRKMCMATDGQQRPATQ